MTQLDLFPPPESIARRLYHGEEPAFVRHEGQVFVVRRHDVPDDLDQLWLRCDGWGVDEETAVKNAVDAQFEG